MRSAPIFAFLVMALSFVIARPAGAADPDIKKLFDAYKSGYDKLAELPTKNTVVKEAKKALMERFRSALGTEFTALFYLAFKDPINDARDSVEPAIKVLDGQYKVSEKTVKALEKLEKDLTPAVTKLEKRVTLLNTGWTTANTTVNSLVDRIRALGGQASLEIFDVRYAFYPARPLRRPIGRGERSMILPGAARFAGCIPSCGLPSGDGGSSSGHVSDVAKLAKGAGFTSAVSNSLTKGELDELKSYVSKDGPKGLQNIPDMDEMLDRPNLKKLMPKPPKLPAPPADLPSLETTISGLQEKLEAARKARDDFATQRTDAEAALAEAKAALESNAADLAAAKARVAAFKSDLKTLKSRSNALKRTRVIWADAILFGKSSADQLFTSAKTPFTTDVTLFGEKVKVKTTFDFKDPENSMTTIFDKLRAHKSYKNTVEG